MPVNPRHSSRTLDYLDTVSDMADALTEALLILKEDSASTADQALLTTAGQFAELVKHVGTWSTDEAYVPYGEEDRTWTQRVDAGQAHQVSIPPHALKYFSHGAGSQSPATFDQHVHADLEERH